MTETTPTPPTHADRGPRNPRMLALQVLRLPAAFALLVLVGHLRPSIAQLVGLYADSGPSYTVAWLRMVLAAFAFMLIVAVGRQRRAPVPLLLVEVAVAATLGFVPPYLWGSWLNHHPFSFVIGSEFVAPLAIAWFAVCIAALVRQWRQHEQSLGLSSEDEPANGSRSARVGAWLKWLRIPALVGVLLLVATQRRELALAWSAATFTAAWVPLTLTALAFLTIAVVGRHRVPWPVLAVEIVLAGMLAFTPRFQWLTWLGGNELGTAFLSEFTSPLAIAWFALALIAALERSRSHRSPTG